MNKLIPSSTSAPPDRDSYFIDDGSASVALIVLAVMAYVTMFAETYADNGDRYTPLQIVVLLCLGVAYVFFGMRLEMWLLRRTVKPWTHLGYYGTMFSLSVAIGVVGEAQGQWWLLVLPVAGYGGEEDSVWGMGLVGGAAIGVIMGVYYGVYGWIDDLLFIPVYTLPAVVFVILFSRIANRERENRVEVERLAGELRWANQKLSEYAAEVEQLAVMRERTRMAREIHDSLGHYLTVVNVQIGAAKAVMVHDADRAQDALGKAQKLTREGLSEVRHAVSLMRSEREERPLTAAIPELIEVTRTVGIDTDFVVTGEERPLAPAVSRAAYRTVQEALTNVRKHAGANAVRVTADFTHPTQMQVTVRDDGRGAADTSGGFGLLGMRERVQLAGGELHIDTAPGEGTTITAVLPTKDEENNDDD